MTWQPKSSLTVETSHWTSRTWILCLSALPPDSGTLVYKWNATFTLIWKEDFGPLSNSPVIFLLSPGKMLLTMFLIQKWLQLFSWRCLSVVTLDALTPASVHSLWSAPKCLNQLCSTVFSSLWSSLLLVHIFLPNFFQSTLHLICFNTALIEQSPLSVMTLCYLLSLWRVSMIVFWTIAKSAVFPIIVLSKNKRCPQCILYGWSFIKTQI